MFGSSRRPDATLCWGPYTVSWKTILDVCGCYGYIDKITHPHYLGHQKPLAGRLGEIYARRVPGSTMKLLEALLLGRDRFASESRDFVYAFLGRADLGADMIAPDYTKTLESVFGDALEVILRQEKTLDILGYCRRYMAPDEFDEVTKTWPSWLPEWSHKHLGRDIETKNSILAGRGHRIFRASKETGAHVTLSLNRRMLTVKGVFLTHYQNTFGGRNRYGAQQSRAAALAHTTFLAQATIDEMP
jgi:hypothetical protein